MQKTRTNAGMELGDARWNIMYSTLLLKKRKDVWTDLKVFIERKKAQPKDESASGISNVSTQKVARNKFKSAKE